MEVKHEDKNLDTYYLQMACSMVGFNFDYIHMDLVMRLQEAVKKKKGKFSVSDLLDIQQRWKDDWDFYFKTIKEQEQKQTHSIPDQMKPQ